MVVKLTKIGDSVAVVLDQKLAEQLGMTPESEVEVTQEGKHLIVRHIREERYRRAAESLSRWQQEAGDYDQRTWRALEDEIPAAEFGETIE